MNDAATAMFKYDHNGLRTEKYVKQNGTETTTKYIYSGTRLVHMTQGSNWLHFFYDGSGQPAEMNFNGTVYIYVKNLQGDIVGIVDTTGRIVVEYKYDAWGRPTYSNSLVDSNSTLTARYALMLTLNPFRYRGYVYDEDIELYYLFSRYYNPTVMRFLNADEINDAFIIWRVDNCFSYCNCCPVMYIDEDGCLGKIFELGKGWSFRIDPPNAGDAAKRHNHVWKEGGPEYAQNADGSTHEGLSGTPPKWVRNKLKDMNKWIWKDNDDSSKPSFSPKPTPSPSPSPTPYPTPAPATAPLPEPTRSTEKKQSQNKSHIVNWEVVEATGIIAGVIYLGFKIALVPYTGGLSLVLP